MVGRLRKEKLGITTRKYNSSKPLFKMAAARMLNEPFPADCSILAARQPETNDHQRHG